MDSTPDSDQFTKLQPAFDALPAILKAEKSRQGLTNQQPQISPGFRWQPQAEF